MTTTHILLLLIALLSFLGGVNLLIALATGKYLNWVSAIGSLLAVLVDLLGLWKC